MASINRQWLEELWTRLDTNGDEKVSGAELLEFLTNPKGSKLPSRMHHPGMNDHEAAETIKAKVESHSGAAITWAEMCELFGIEKGEGSTPGVQCSEVPTEISLAWLRELFVRMDRNGDGSIARHELMKYLQGDAEFAASLHLPQKFRLGSQAHAHFEKVYEAMSNTEDDVTWSTLCDFFGMGASDAPAAEEMDFEGLMNYSTPQVKPKIPPRSASSLAMHPPPEERMPRCETPALQTRALTPILSEQHFKEGGWEEKLCSQHRVEYRSGCAYEGQWGFGDFHGKGKLEESDGGVYDGEWFEGKRNGRGHQIWAKAAGEYTGDWDEDKRHGMGTHKNAAGDVYEGNWTANHRRGKGKCTYSTGNVYEGQWVNDTKEGVGVMKWADGDSYEGQWSDDRMHGTGHFTTKDGSTFAGMYRKGKFIKRVLDKKSILGPKAMTAGSAPYGMRRET